VSYRYKPGGDLADQTRRIAASQIAAASEALTRGGPEDIHDARKRCKKLRGLLRLVRGDLGRTAYRRENIAFRDVARALSGPRDEQARLEALDALARRYPRQARFAELRKRLAPGADHRLAHVDQALSDGLAALEAASARLEGWPLSLERSIRPLLAGFEKTYARGRDAQAQARRSPDTESLHALRKQAKYHLFHLRLLQQAWPVPMRARRRELARLSDLLGDDHDLAVLAAHLLDHRAAFEPRVPIDPLMTLIEARRAELRMDALALGARVFAEKPSRLSKRVRRYWDAPRRVGAGE
jgi:CHAD domain-containing protein